MARLSIDGELAMVIVIYENWTVGGNKHYHMNSVLAMTIGKRRDSESEEDSLPWNFIVWCSFVLVLAKWNSS